jgi:hypothetical protein
MLSELMEHYRDLAAKGESSPARIEGQIAAAAFKARLGSTEVSERADLYQFCADMCRWIAEEEARRVDR